MKQKGIPVLMYHALEDEQHPAGARDQGEQIYIVSAKNFREQMQYLYSNGFQTYLLNDLLALDSWPHMGIVITFDDGHESNFTLALPILQEFGFKAEFFITTGWIGTKHFLKPEQIVELHKAGMAISSHSVNHPYFDDLSNESIRTEFSNSRNTLSNIIGQDITGFSAPGGRLKPSVAETAKKCGYHFMCTSTPRAFIKKKSPFAIPRFAVREQMLLKEFSRIVNLNFTLLNIIKAKELFLYHAKKLLGNKLYEKLRKTII